MNDTLVHEDFATRCQKVLQVAKELYQGNPDWVTFFREVLGVNGAARSVFPSQEEFITFEKSDVYTQVQQMVGALRGRKVSGNCHNEATRVITVRLPESLHEALKAEASDHNTSMNKLCISKLLQVLLEEANAAARPAQRNNFVPPTPASPMSRPTGTAPTASVRPQSPSPGMGTTSPSPTQFRSNY